MLENMIAITLFVKLIKKNAPEVLKDLKEEVYAEADQWHAKQKNSSANEGPSEWSLDLRFRDYQKNKSHPSIWMAVAYRRFIYLPT